MAVRNWWDDGTALPSGSGSRAGGYGPGVGDEVRSTVDALGAAMLGGLAFGAKGASDHYGGLSGHGFAFNTLMPAWGLSERVAAGVSDRLGIADWFDARSDELLVAGVRMDQEMTINAAAGSVVGLFLLDAVNGRLIGKSVSKGLSRAKKGLSGLADSKYVRNSVADASDFLKRGPVAELMGGHSARDINPVGRLGRTGRTQNCANCALALDATLDGRASSALPGGPTTASELASRTRHTHLLLPARILPIGVQVPDWRLLD